MLNVASVFFSNIILEMKWLKGHEPSVSLENQEIVKTEFIFFIKIWLNSYFIFIEMLCDAIVNLIYL